MRRLMLLRHAKTEHDAPSGHDQDRRLDDRGRLDAAAIGAWIGRHPPFPDAVLVSTAVRAHQTWEIAREAMKDAVREQRRSRRSNCSTNSTAPSRRSSCRSSAWPRSPIPRA